MDDITQQFVKQGYINVETYRKNGDGVKTPVWFVEHEGRFFIRTRTNSWKVKRIRQRPYVRFSPCKADGTLCGKWVEGQAAIVNDLPWEEEINRRMRSKYGLNKIFLDLVSALFRRKYLMIEITPKLSA